jgi:hypothetical protein
MKTRAEREMAEPRRGATRRSPRQKSRPNARSPRSSPRRAGCGRPRSSCRTI